MKAELAVSDTAEVPDTSDRIGLDIPEDGIKTTEWTLIPCNSTQVSTFNCYDN